MKLSEVGKPIGGYFELEINKNSEYHKNSIRLNTGRNCLEYILRARKYKRVFVPYYTCEVIFESFKRSNTEFEFYNINEYLEPIKINPKKNEAVLYTNYFGIKSLCVKKLSRIYDNLIIDNSQAFFDRPLNGVDTFYSPRKFFGVPDGGYLYTDKIIDMKLLTDISYSRILHLAKRIDISPESGYNDFKTSENSLDKLPIKYMSLLTRRMLSGVDYEMIKNIRYSNFIYLHNELGELNQLNISIGKFTPMSYPLLITKNLHEKLIKNRIFVPIYWPNLLKSSSKTKFESKLANNLHALPIDQRYNKSDLDKIIFFIRKYA